jgi:hypothetical protein
MEPKVAWALLKRRGGFDERVRQGRLFQLSVDHVAIIRDLARRPAGD